MGDINTTRDDLRRLDADLHAGGDGLCFDIAGVVREALGTIDHLCQEVRNERDTQRSKDTSIGEAGNFITLQNVEIDDLKAALDHLTTENAALLNQVDELSRALGLAEGRAMGAEMAKAEYERMRTENARLERERDAAVADLKEESPCACCEHLDSDSCIGLRDYNDCNGKGWQWRGVQPEGVEP